MEIFCLGRHKHPYRTRTCSLPAGKCGHWFISKRFCRIEIDSSEMGHLFVSKWDLNPHKSSGDFRLLLHEFMFPQMLQQKGCMREWKRSSLFESHCLPRFSRLGDQDFPIPHLWAWLAWMLERTLDREGFTSKRALSKKFSQTNLLPCLPALSKSFLSLQDAQTR